MKGLVLCLLSILVACSLAPKPPPAPPRTTKLGLQLERLELDNGLRVVLVHDAHAREIQVTTRYAVGSVDEPAGQAGIAHLVEHLMFQQVIGSESVFAHLEASATDFNGFTTHDATTYVARATPDKLDELVLIDSVRVGLRCTSISDSVFAREREVVINELRLRGDASTLLGALYRAVYPEGHPYRNEIGGSEASVAALTRDQACAFADAHYAPSNAVMVISGDLTAAQVEHSLKKFLTHLPRRATQPPVDVPALGDAGTAHASVEAPIDEDALFVAWPLPQDPLARVQVEAIARTVKAIVDGKVRGKVQLVPLGDVRAPVLGLIVIPAKDETDLDVLHAVDGATNALPAVLSADGIIPFGKLLFDNIQQTAIYQLFAEFDDVERRDTVIATEVLAGRDPSDVLALQFRGLRELTPRSAVAVATEFLSLRHARVATLRAHKTKEAGTIAVAAAIHDLGQRRDVPDPTLAATPLSSPSPPPATNALRTRTLPNGMKVVLMPLTSVPTVDVRLVFASGTADDPSDRRGVALLAADTLTWNIRYLNDMLAFAAAGGEIRPVPDLDRTTFIARGLDMHLDYLLAGLRRLVREGRYDTNDVAAVLHRETKLDADEGAFTDAWRTAIYGAGHPYVAAGVVRHVDPAITRDDLERFRASHYVPGNATLVIAGRFDAALADRWVDYLFADWTAASPAPTVTAPAIPRPVTIARYEAGPQLRIGIAIPLAPTADAGVSAQRLIVADMLGTLAEDVRHQLGATYAFSGSLVTARFAEEYAVGGIVEAARATEAMQLLEQRIGALRDDLEVAARAFVAARARVVTQLRSLANGAAPLAGRVERDAGLARPALFDLEIATRATALTVDQIAPALADLELRRAAIAMRGPEAAITTALATLHRTATVVGPAAPATPTRSSEPTPMVFDDSDRVGPGDIEDALTGDHEASHLGDSLAFGYTAGSIGDLDVSGTTLAGEVGYRFDAVTTLGAHLELGYMGGDYVAGTTMPIMHHVSAVPIEIGLFARAESRNRIWGSAFFALHFLHADDDVVTTWTNGITAGLEAGVDIYRVRAQEVSLYGRLQGVLLSDAGFDVFTVGLAIRR